MVNYQVLPTRQNDAVLKDMNLVFFSRRNPESDSIDFHHTPRFSKKKSEVAL